MTVGCCDDVIWWDVVMVGCCDGGMLVGCCDGGMV